MPNRILRDGILRSEKVAKLTPTAELFYRRLMSVVDDFGRYYANESLLLSDCYPIRPSWADVEMISKWLGECRQANLVSVYEVNGTRFLEIEGFNQRLRPGQCSKFPESAGIRGKNPRTAGNFGLGGGVVVGEVGGDDVGGRVAVRKIPQIAETPEPEMKGDGPIETIQNWLSQYVGHFGKDWGLPDHGVCFSVFRAMNGASLDDLELVLRDLYKRKQSPGKNYAWFVPVLAARFEAKNGSTRS